MAKKSSKSSKGGGGLQSTAGVGQGNPFQGGITGKTGTTPLDIFNAQNLAQNLGIAKDIALNRVGEVTPFGTSRYTMDPTTGQMTRVSSIGDLSPEQIQQMVGQQYRTQMERDTALGEQAKGLLSQIGQAYSQPMDYSRLTQMPSMDQLGAERQRIEDQLYNRYSSVMEPQFQKERQQLEQSMANRGIPRGGELYTRELAQLEQRQNDARQAARTQSVQFGGQEQGNLFNLAQQARNQQIQEMGQLRANPLAEYRGLLSSINPVSMPSFAGMSQIGVGQQNLADLMMDPIKYQQSLKLAGAQRGPYTDPFKLAQFQSDLSQKELENKLRLNQQYNPRPGTGDYLGQIGAEAGKSFFSSAAQGLGNRLFGTSK